MCVVGDIGVYTFAKRCATVLAKCNRGGRHCMSYASDEVIHCLAIVAVTISSLYLQTIRWFAKCA